MNDAAQTPKFSWIRVAIVVTAIIVTGYLLLGSQVSSHRAARTPQNLNNLHLIGIAMTNYTTGNGGYLPPSPAGALEHNWRVSLSPYLDDSDLVLGYHHDAAWDSQKNNATTNQWVPTMTSPYRPKPRKDARGRGYRDYGMVTGPGTISPPEGPVALDFVSEHDGLGQTLLVGECSGLQLIWTEPRDPDVSREKMKIATVTSREPTSDALLSSYSQFGVCVLCADGSAKQLSKDLDPKVLTALCTLAGGEVIRPEDIR